ncbi:nuclease, putative [Ricinus communis]|uniref:Nuclease, putative n=1 Tax=Ricinus communis TaxID=3988 RepID=B9SX78_RICCO|nr:nuclease, putative [Ricinus communis]
MVIQRAIPGSAGGGGLFRNEFGDWIGGYVVHIGYCTAIEAELWAALQGLLIARRRGYQRLVLEVDSQLLVAWPTSLSVLEGKCANLVQTCRGLEHEFSSFQVQHVFQEGNRPG